MEEIYFWFVSLTGATLRMSAPLIFAAIGGLFSERSGIVDIGLEGKILIGAFAAATISYYTGSPWLGLIAAIVASILFALLHGFACISNQGNQVISGVAINILAIGLTSLFGVALFKQGGSTPHLGYEARFNSIELIPKSVLDHIPVIGKLFDDLLNNHTIMVYIALLLIPFTSFVMYKTRFGLRLRAVGESPKAVDTAGISVTLLRYKAVICTGVFCGFSGAYLSIAQGASFVNQMSAGKGFLALAALIFGKWRPYTTLLACFLFAFTDALQARLQGVAIPGIGVIPVQFIQMLPYILTVLLLAGIVGKAVAPKAIGKPYLKER